MFGKYLAILFAGVVLLSAPMLGAQTIQPEIGIPGIEPKFGEPKVEPEFPEDSSTEKESEFDEGESSSSGYGRAGSSDVEYVDGGSKTNADSTSVPDDASGNSSGENSPVGHQAFSVGIMMAVGAIGITAIIARRLR
jgi:hypothetical protein